MKITGAEFYIVRLPKRREHTWASNTKLTIGRHVLVRLLTDEGVDGWGEAPALPTWGGANGRYYGETAETVAHLGKDHLVPAIVGCDPQHIATIHARMDAVVKGNPYAKAAIDIACFDAAGKALGLPVWAMLGGKHREGVLIAHSLGLMPIEQCVEEAQAAVADGARTIKVKTGKDARRDIEVVAKLREVLGSDVQIRVDGNEGYTTPHEAITVTRAQEEYDILLCEQPVAGLKALARVAAGVNTPVMADESAWNALDIVELDAANAAACYSLYVTKPGGLYRARQQAEIAAALGMYSDIGGSIEMGIGNAANLHLGVAMPTAWLPSVCPMTTVAGIPGPSTACVYYTDDVVIQPFRFQDGMLLPPDGPGLGVEVDMDKVKAYSD
ncbi:mandelate racemase/muconate lactonizing enzyme family protein [Pseudonocardia thermophila]|uniref:mandelate racemase/muconate lactonizing enzyme family protein n=1 Tax=Pseudonocardia thermophila TaxID=1848 RepID=UPI00248F0D32|nr:enolase C-terminal domain-like protein [Pseudonocardia thermophila]